jgi:hypothetical protein
MWPASPRPVLRLALPAILAGSLLAGCSGGYDYGSSPQTLNYDDLARTPPPPPPVPPVPPSVEPDSDVQADADAPPVPTPDKAAGDQRANHHRELSAPGIEHDLTVGAGGYVVGRQAEHLVRRALKHRSLVAAGETAGEASAIGVGAAATRAATSGAITAGAEGGVAAAEGGAAATGAEAAGVLGSEELVGAGLGLGAGEAIIGGLIVVGAGVAIYQAYESYKHAQQETAAHGQ